VTADPEREDADVRDAREWMRHARRGDLGAAWAVSDRIRTRHRGVRDWPLPRHLQQVWDGRPLSGQRVLIRCYHGLGDTIQFIRYAPLVHDIARSVIVWAQPALLPLLRRVRGVDNLLPLHDGSPDVEYDVDVELMELPYVFRTTLATIPAAVPYLEAEPRPIGGQGLRVGLVWRAGDWDSRRSIPFDEMASLFASPGVSWYSLQLEARPNERHDRLIALDVAGVLPTAEAMRALDLVVSIDSMTAHLAGALAVSVWTLLPHEADWRWMERRNDSPWYPTMRLFRQRSPGEWRDVIDEVRQALARLV
jgi:hypothetical protein